MPVSPVIPVSREERNLSLFMPRLHPEGSERAAAVDCMRYVVSETFTPQSAPNGGRERTLQAQ